MSLTDEEIRVGILDQFRNTDKARSAIKEYYFGGGGFDKKPGAAFDRFATISEPDYITANDIVAVSTLAVTVPPAAATWLLLDEGRQQTHDLLLKIPTDVDIWRAAEHIRDGSPLWNLWDLVDDQHGIAETICSKLLAVKRPRLVPIQDSVTNKFLGVTIVVWKAIFHTLSRPEDRALIEAATMDAPEYVTLLRRMDVVLWSLNRKGV
ncbi:MAG: DUF6308 family protein [Chthonomonadales bacterium]